MIVSTGPEPTIVSISTKAAITANRIATPCKINSLSAELLRIAESLCADFTAVVASSGGFELGSTVDAVGST